MKELDWVEQGNDSNLDSPLRATNSFTFTIPKAFTFTIPKEGKYFTPTPAIYRRIGDTLEINSTPKKCEHQWIDVGFMHSKLICKHCNQDQ